MARPRRRPLVPVTTSLLLLAVGLLIAAAAAADTPQEEKMVGMRMQYADEEEARWLDRFAETHEPLGVAKGPLLMRRATEEEARWMNHFSGPKDGGRGAGAGAAGNVLEFDLDNPYYHALKAWVNRLIKESGGIKFVDEPHVEKEFHDLLGD